MSCSERPYWWDSAPELCVPATPLPSRVDVAIVGGGYTGLSAALALARRGARVAVLERHAIGWGASSRNGGQIITGLTLDADELIARYGLERARVLFAWSLRVIDALDELTVAEQIDCELTRCGHIAAAAAPAHVRLLAREHEQVARHFSYETTLLAPPESRAELGSDAFHGVLVDPGSARLHPAKYVRGLACAALRAGAGLHEQTAVTEARPDASGFQLDTNRGRVHADLVLIATNGYTDDMAPALQQRLVRVGSYLIATAPLPRDVADRILPTRRVAYDSKFLLHYFSLTPDRRLIFGGRATFSAASARAVAVSARRLRRDMGRIFPELAGVPVEHAWGGQVAIARDRMPHVGRLGGMYFAAGYAGHGVAIATALGAAVARMMSGESPDAAVGIMMDAPFRPYPMLGTQAWFLPAVGIWYKARDLVG
ncbi:MAG TPA: FAD-binding oxidoreductase [Vicinamibacterales bacterium]